MILSGPRDHIPTISMRELVEVHSLRLRLLEGADGLDRQIRWAHVTELVDPTPWLRGGEFIMTMGSALVSPEACDTFVRALVTKNACGIGFGTHNFHSEAPAALRDACRNQQMPLVEIPLTTSFLSINEFVARRLVERVTDPLSQPSRIHSRLVAAMDNGRGLTRMAEVLAQVLLRPIVVLDFQGRLVGTAALGLSKDDVAACVDRCHPLRNPLAGTANRKALVANFVSVRHQSQPLGWIGWLGDSEAPSDAETKTLTGVSPLLALELLANRHGRVRDQEETGRLLEVIADGSAHPQAIAPQLSNLSLDLDQLTAVAILGVSVDRDFDAPRTLIGRVGTTVLAIGSDVDDLLDQATIVGKRVGLGSTVHVADLRRSLREARSAANLADAEGSIATWRDLATVDALLARLSSAELIAFLRLLIQPLTQVGDPTALIDTLRIYIREDGSVERTAARLSMHPNSVRHRLNRIRALVGRDPSSLLDQMAFYIGLTAWDRGRDALSRSAVESSAPPPHRSRRIRPRQAGGRGRPPPRVSSQGPNSDRG